MRKRRAAVVGVGFVAFIVMLALSPLLFQDFIKEAIAPFTGVAESSYQQEGSSVGVDALNKIEIKGRAPKTGYARAEFGNGWGKIQGCSVREVILYRDLTDVVMKNECQIQSGVLDDPYTGESIVFTRDNPSAVQIDHVVALSDAWQKGAQNLTKERRISLANDSLNLIASDGPANQHKGDADAASWLPKNKDFRCEYIRRQVEVKLRYSLWVTAAEHDAMKAVLVRC